jgi:hypothetical protein
MFPLKAETKQILLREQWERRIEQDFEHWFWKNFGGLQARYKGKKYLRKLLGDYCWGCGCKTNQLQLHHRVPLSLGGPDELENYSLVCPECHGRIHRGEMVLKKKVKLGK